MSSHSLLVEHIKGNLSTLRLNAGDDPGNPQATNANFPYPVGVRKIAVSAVNPKVITASDLPIAFYGMGEGNALQGVRYGTEFRGEAFRVLLNIVLEKLTGDSLLVESAARMTDAVSHAVEGILNVKPTSPFAIDDAFIERYTPFSGGISDREFMQYVITTNFYYGG